jgi:hypothetical protein
MHAQKMAGSFAVSNSEKRIEKRFRAFNHSKIIKKNENIINSDFADGAIFLRR